MSSLELRRRIMVQSEPADIIIHRKWSDNDGYIMDVIYVKGWSKSKNYMTKREAEAVTNIGNAFSGNTKITNLNVLKYFINATKSISFSGCTSLSSVTIPENINILYSNLLKETLVEYLFIPKNVIKVSKNSNSFSGANYMKWVDVDENNTKYHSYNGILYESSTFTCFYCPPKLTGIISIKPGTKIIYNNFLQYKTKKITLIDIPDGVERIGDYAFMMSSWGISTSQGTLRIPSSVTYLGIYFARGSGFEKVEYYSGVKIPEGAFLSCILLKTLVIYCEEGVVDLTLVNYNGDYKTYHPFRDTPLETIYVPDSLLAAYKNSENWKLGINLTSKMRPLSEYTG